MLARAPRLDDVPARAQACLDTERVRRSSGGRGWTRRFVLLDQASLLKSRNHHRVLRRELDRVRALIEAVSGDVDPALSALLEDPDGPGD